MNTIQPATEYVPITKWIGGNPFVPPSEQEKIAKTRQRQMRDHTLRIETKAFLIKTFPDSAGSSITAMLGRMMISQKKGAEPIRSDRNLRKAILFACVRHGILSNVKKYGEVIDHFLSMAATHQ